MGAEEASGELRSESAGTTEYVGEHLGFKPVEEPLVVSDAVAYEIERRLDRLVRWRIRAKRARYGYTGPINFDRRRTGNGLVAFGVGPRMF